MKIKIDEVRINSGRREARVDNVQELAKSIAEIGLLNPVTVTADNILIAGRHRLEAARLLGWTEIECTVCEVDGLLAELAEIDENMVRTNLSPIEFGDLLLKRKQIYETLHPETRQGMRNGQTSKNDNLSVLETRSFTQDTADKLGVSPRTVERQVQIAKNLTPETKEILQSSGKKITKRDALNLSRLEPEQQEKAAQEMSDMEKCLNKYRKPPAPYSIGGKHFDSMEESIADLKNPNKDASYTAGTLLAAMDGFIDHFHWNFSWYSSPECTVAFPLINQEQFDYISERFEDVCGEIHEMLQVLETAISEK
ncbi:ParB/RepB/Spo0J family partition protein [Acutalibacter caecimuris]|uniref:ParB/RepB/Spo0J family partition protein n=1 Tax=Acutalibacter caecimuris TaxID=3093657 RepID=UPI002AC99377|nr:ParB N-terminal domain-containing protein [Acutalibacter sp. M00118]